MKIILRRFFLLIIIMIVFIVSLIFINKNDVETKDLLAYADTSLVNIEETTISEETTSEETTTTSEITTTVVTTKTTTKENVVSGIGEIKGNVDIHYLNLLNSELNKLPINVLNKFKSMGWHIYVTDENIAKTVFNGKYKSVQGVTVYSDSIILIEARETAIKESTIHEFGHFIDYTYKNMYIKGFISDTNSFKSIYNEEVDLFKSRITNSSCVRDEQEFFAETLYYIYKNPSKCTPKAYEYVNSVLNDF